MEILTFFEGNVYKKIKAIVQIENESAIAIATTFIWKDDLAYLVKDDWDIKEFEKIN